MRQWTRAALLGLIALVAIGSALSLLEESPKSITNYTSSAGECVEDGVSLVIDFGTSGSNPVITRCAIDFEGSGWELFEATQTVVQGTSQYPVGFVCRIENFPTPETQDCLDTPQYSEGSWGYFLLDENGNWKVSGIGSAQRKTKCGLAEGWRFIEAGEDIGSLQPRANITPRKCS